MLQHLINSLQLFLNATALLMFVLMMWALVGLQFFKGKMRQRCHFSVNGESSEQEFIEATYFNFEIV